MKAVFLCFLGAAAVALAYPGGQYTDKYDSVDLDQVLNNHRLLEGYLKCILDEGRCTPDGKELQSHITEAMEQNCAKCTDKQRTGTRRVIGHIINNEPLWWDKLKAKFDKNGKYSKKYEDDLRKL